MRPSKPSVDCLLDDRGGDLATVDTEIESYDPTKRKCMTEGAYKDKPKCARNLCVRACCRACCHACVRARGRAAWTCVHAVPVRAAQVKSHAVSYVRSAGIGAAHLNGTRQLCATTPMASCDPPPCFLIAAALTFEYLLLLA